MLGSFDSSHSKCFSKFYQMAFTPLKMESRTTKRQIYTPIVDQRSTFRNNAGHVYQIIIIIRHLTSSENDKKSSNSIGSTRIVNTPWLLSSLISNYILIIFRKCFVLYFYYVGTQIQINFRTSNKILIIVFPFDINRNDSLERCYKPDFIANKVLMIFK